MVAHRDLKAGDIILKERALVTGPNLEQSALLCLGCYRHGDQISHLVWTLIWKAFSSIHIINLLKSRKNIATQQCFVTWNLNGFVYKTQLYLSYRICQGVIHKPYEQFVDIWLTPPSLPPFMSTLFMDDPIWQLTSRMQIYCKPPFLVRTFVKKWVTDKHIWFLKVHSNLHKRCFTGDFWFLITLID